MVWQVFPNSIRGGRGRGRGDWKFCWGDFLLLGGGNLRRSEFNHKSKNGTGAMTTAKSEVFIGL